MPMVNGKRFSYDNQGRAAAKRAAIKETMGSMGPSARSPRVSPAPAAGSQPPAKGTGAGRIPMRRTPASGGISTQPVKLPSTGSNPPSRVKRTY